MTQRFADLDPAMTERLEAAAFRRLVMHLRARTDVQNIDLMNLAGFCRNCLGNWIEDAARTEAVDLPRAAAREHVYGMPQDEWKARYQRDASPEQQRAFAAAAPAHEAASDEQPASGGSST